MLIDRKTHAKLGAGGPADRAYLMDIGAITRRLSGEELSTDGDWLASFVSGADASQSAA